MFTYLENIAMVHNAYRKLVGRAENKSQQHNSTRIFLSTNLMSLHKAFDYLHGNIDIPNAISVLLRQ